MINYIFLIVIIIIIFLLIINYDKKIVRKKACKTIYILKNEKFNELHKE